MHLQIVKETKFYKAFCENGSPQPFTFLDATAFSFASGSCSLYLVPSGSCSG